MKKLIILGALVCSLGVAHATVFNFTMALTGAQEIPANPSTAAGGGIASFDDSSGMISASVFFVGLSAPATASHIHLGAPGVNGPVIVSFVPFTPSATFGSIVGTSLAFPAADVSALLAGNTYFNIHTSNYPGGEIRGQLIPVVPVPEPASLALAGMGLALAVRFFRRK